MKIKCLRIHYDSADNDYTIFDRHGKFITRRVKPIRIENLPPVKYFGFCPIETVDVTLEFETPIDSKLIKVNA